MAGLALVAACSGPPSADPPPAPTSTPTATTTPTAAATPTATPTVTKTAAATRPPAAPDPVTALVRRLQPFVERHAGLRFRAPVQAELLPPATFQARVAKAFAIDATDVAATKTTLVALGLLEPSVDLAGEYEELFTGLVGGFYDTETNRLVVRAASITPRTRVILVHELVHALADQHVELYRPALDDAPDESSLGLSVLAEGHAERVEAAYRATLTAAERRSVRREAAAMGADVPAVLRQLLAVPYDAGPPLVAEILAAGGIGRLVSAYRTPPATSEQFLHPSRFVDRHPALPVAEPRADAAVADEGVLGELVLRLALTPRVGRARAVEAAAGWGGDRYVAWRAGTRSCLRANIVMDTGNDTAQLRDALAAWRGAVVRDGSPVTLTICR